MWWAREWEAAGTFNIRHQSSREKREFTSKFQAVWNKFHRLFFQECQRVRTFFDLIFSPVELALLTGTPPSRHGSRHEQVLSAEKWTEKTPTRRFDVYWSCASKCSLMVYSCNALTLSPPIPTASLHISWGKDSLVVFMRRFMFETAIKFYTLTDLRWMWSFFLLFFLIHFHRSFFVFMKWREHTSERIVWRWEQTLWVCVWSEMELNFKFHSVLDRKQLSHAAAESRIFSMYMREWNEIKRH